MTTIKLIPFLLFCATLSFGQTTTKTGQKKPATKTKPKVDIKVTGDWIKEKLETFSPIVYNFGKQQDELMVRTVTIDNCKLLIKDTGEGAYGYETFEIPLNDIYVPTFNSNPDWPTNMEMIFVVKSRQKNIVRKLVIYSNESANKTEYLSQIEIKIHKRCVEEKMTYRFKNAFTDMINSCGGSVTSDAY